MEIDKLPGLNAAYKIQVMSSVPGEALATSSLAAALSGVVSRSGMVRVMLGQPRFVGDVNARARIKHLSLVSLRSIP